MTPALFLAIAVAGGLGAACRFLLDGAVSARARRPFPLGTVVVNVSGSLLLGFATGLAISGLLPAEWTLVIGSGFLGGYTTFSTASYETVRLAADRRFAAAALHGLGMLGSTTVAAALGLLLGWLL